MGTPEAPVEGRLDDGTPVLFRPLGPGDRDGLREGIRRLSPESRFRRFFSPLERLSETELAYLTNVDWQDHVAWLAVLPDAPGAPGVGVARWIRSPDAPDTAEAAVAVIDEYQRRGIGSALLRLAAESALRLGIRRFKTFALAENRPMMAILESAGAQLDSRDGAVVEMSVPLPASIEELHRSPAPRILRAAAAGEVEGEAGERGRGTRFIGGRPGGADP